MNNIKVERAAKWITALLFVLSVTMFVLVFVVQPKLLGARMAPVSEVESVAVEHIEIITLKEVVEYPIEVEVVEHIVEPDIEPDTNTSEVVYFDVPLSEDLQDHIFATCRDYNVDPALVMAIIDKESDFNIDASGDYGRSQGLMQVQSQWFGEQMAAHGFDNLIDPYQNVVIGTEYLADLMSQGRGENWALMAYNGGPAYANSMGDFVSDYVIEVKDMWTAYSESR